MLLIIILVKKIYFCRFARNQFISFLGSKFGSRHEEALSSNFKSSGINEGLHGNFLLRLRLHLVPRSESFKAFMLDLKLSHQFNNDNFTNNNQIDLKMVYLESEEHFTHLDFKNVTFLEKL